jgi:hypothetical protein
MKKNHLFNGVFALVISSVILPGCSKQVNSSNPDAANPTIANGYVITPEGPILAAHVHRLEPGYHLSIQNGHVLKVHTASGKVMADFGLAHPQTGGPVNQKAVAGGSTNKFIAPQVAGWITYAQWSNTTGQPIQYFNTACIVPPAPTTADNQLIYLFEGLQDAISGSDIMQPVLQWGYNGSFGGSYWCIANWYVYGNNQAVISGPENNIAPGTSLSASLTAAGRQSDGSYNYVSIFNGHPYSAMHITEGNQYKNFYDTLVLTPLPSIPVQTAAFITLEDYHNGIPELGQQSDYPAVAAANFTNIQMGLTNELAPLTWSPEITQYAAFGENTVVQSNDVVGNGEVDLWFRGFQSPRINGTAQGYVLLYEGSPTASGTITALAGQSVNVEAYTFAKDQGLTQTVRFSFTTNGIDFIPGGNFITATNSSVTERFIMPATGTVNWSATYTQTGGSSHPYDGANIHVF